jgi:transposase
MDLSPIVKSSAGLDVHLKTIVVTLLQEVDHGELKETVKEFSTFPQELKNIATWLHQENVELAVLESTGVYWKGIFEALEAQKVKTYVVNARSVKQIPGKKTDVSDSKWLATLARYGLVKGSFIPEKELRHLRLVTRYRAKTKSVIASEVNRMHKVLSDAGVSLSLVFSDIQCISAWAVIDGLVNGESLSSLVSTLKGKSKKKERELIAILSKPLSYHHKFLLKTIKEHIDYLRKQCEQLDLEIFAAMQPYDKQWKILQTIPGIDMLSAACIIAETGIDMKQFETSEKFCAWAGMCPGNNESAGKRKSAGTVKGSPSLRKILCEVANSAIKTTSQFKCYYQALQIRRGYKRAIIASGHKILRVIFKLLSSGLAYFDPDVNYEELMVKRNAPRWLQCLTKYGYLTPATP